MSSSADAAYSGSIPELYDKLLVPVLFAPYAEALARAAAALAPLRLLEIAAGTGVVTRLLTTRLPDAAITATDLNADMIAHACAAATWPANVAWSVADAQALPFADAGFDAVLCQFGAMFFPDRTGAYREMRRVLAPGGVLLFNVWDDLAHNRGSAIVEAALGEVLGEPRPCFLSRAPYSCHDENVIAEDLAAAGFRKVTIERVERYCPPGSAAALVDGLIDGSPLGGELALHPEAAQAEARAEARRRLEEAEASGPLAMRALLVTACA